MHEHLNNLFNAFENYYEQVKIIPRIPGNNYCNYSYNGFMITESNGERMLHCSADGNQFNYYHKGTIYHKNSTIVVYDSSQQSITYDKTEKGIVKSHQTTGFRDGEAWKSKFPAFSLSAVNVINNAQAHLPEMLEVWAGILLPGIRKNIQLFQTEIEKLATQEKNMLSILCKNEKSIQNRIDLFSQNP